MDNIGYYIFVLVALIVAFLVVKKVASCLIKSAVLIVLVVALAAIYWLYFMK
jgi:hypothetical protein